MEAGSPGKPSQSLRAIWSNLGSLEGVLRLCEHAHLWVFLESGRGEQHSVNCFSKGALNSKRLGASHVELGFASLANYYP